MKTILVVDDEPGYQALIRFELSDGINYSVLSAGNGPDALKLVKENHVDLIFTDMKMSPMDGVETIEEIKKIQPETPIVIMTGYEMEDRMQKALDLKVKGCLYKPFGIDQLRDVVQRIAV
ncbi:MAG TPA: response regulator [Elusimicrobiota bacterium]|nr:response regulator [Elusimicrobiota bacterium]